jgi:RNA polymerase sigma factor (TIGR02999 family)
MNATQRGESQAREALFETLYRELHGVAKRQLGRQGAALTLGATTLLHETYLDMAARDGASFPDRARFMAYAARVMRGLIVDYARNRRALKRGGQFEITSFDIDVHAAAGDNLELSRLSDALDELAEADPVLTEVVDLKFFCGFSFAEIAAMRGVSERTVQRMWDKARIYLHRSMRSGIAVLS